MWWGWLELNQRPTGYEPAALTAELHPRVAVRYKNVTERLTDESIPDYGV